MTDFINFLPRLLEWTPGQTLVYVLTPMEGDGTRGRHDAPIGTRYPNADRVPAAYHVAAFAYVAFCLWFAANRHQAYRDAMQEDRLVEWASVFVFAAAGVAQLIHAVKRRRAFDLLVALFLLFVAGEEMSWGQRLFGLTPPSYFLEHNTQQEMNLHNFGTVFGGPKGPFTLVLIGYAVLLPLVALVDIGRKVLHRIGATPPPIASIPWFIAAIVLFMWYPVSFTGEWNELLAGSAFLVASGLTNRALIAIAPVGLVTSFALATWSARGREDPARSVCATAELAAIADALRTDVLGTSPAHKRVWTFVGDERIDADSLRARLSGVDCSGSGHEARRQFAVDPWGTAYWMRITRDDILATVTIYSFGPNRRRDIDPAATRSGDDLFVRRSLRWP